MVCGSFVSRVVVVCLAIISVANPAQSEVRYVYTTHLDA
jgi:hypothetical protein